MVRHSIICMGCVIKNPLIKTKHGDFSWTWFQYCLFRFFGQFGCTNMMLLNLSTRRLAQTSREFLARMPGGFWRMAILRWKLKDQTLTPGCQWYAEILPHLDGSIVFVKKKCVTRQAWPNKGYVLQWPKPCLFVEWNPTQVKRGIIYFISHEIRFPINQSVHPLVEVAPFSCFEFITCSRVRY